MHYLNLFKKVEQKISNLLKIFDNSIKHGAVDEYEWAVIYDNSPVLKKINSEGEKLYNNYTSIMEDLFYLLYKTYPEFLDSNQTSTEVGYINKRVMEDIMNLSSFEDLRMYTKEDDINTAVCMVDLSEELHKLTKQKLEDFNKVKKSLEQQLEALKQLLKNAINDEDLTEDQKKAIEDLAKNAGSALGTLTPNINGLSDNIDDLIQKTKEYESIKITWGLEQNDTFKKLPYKDKIKLFEKIRNNEKLKKIAEMLGKFKKLQNSQKSKKISNNINNLQKTKLSNEINHALPNEVVKMFDEDSELLFFNNLVNHSLETFEYEPDIEEIGGPVIVCIDESGSMGGVRDVWSKACILSIVHQAKAENRSVYVIHFSNLNHAKSLKVSKFLKNKDLDINELVSMAEHFYGGGTNFDQPIERMLECFENEKEFSKADGLFITDGECAVSKNILNKLNDFKKSNNFSIYGILIGHWGSSLENFCNKTYKVNELTDDLFIDITGKIFKK